MSRDGGATFEDTGYDDVYPVDQANPYRVAVHPFNGAKAVVAARRGLPIAVTSDFGKTWKNATGVTSVGQIGNFWYPQPMAREMQIDPASPEFTIFYYDGIGVLSVSHDSGATFTPVYTSFPTWQVPFFAVATPPRGVAAAGDVWVFAGWQLYHSVNGGVNMTHVWEFYHPGNAIAVGALPRTVAPSGRAERQLAERCVTRGVNAAAATTPLPAPRRLRDDAPAGYVVYVIGAQDFDQTFALFGSVDAGHTWLSLSGANSTTPEQALGDGAYVLEASEKDPGHIFVGTEGRGSFWRDVSAELRAALLACD